MKYTTIIAGGRNYQFTEKDKSWLDTLPISTVVSGCARGADQEGELWAESRGIPVIKFPADWAEYGKAAGPIRNREMASNSEAVVLFPGGSGTRNMRMQAKRAGLIIWEPYHTPLDSTQITK